MMHGFFVVIRTEVMVIDKVRQPQQFLVLATGQWKIGESVIFIQFFCVYVVVVVRGECVIVFQSEALRHESNVHPVHISDD